MTLQISSTKTHHIDLTPAISDYIEKRLSKIDKLIDKEDTSAQADIEIGKEVPDQHSGDIFYAKIGMHMSEGYVFSDAQKDDLYAAIDTAVDEIVREVRKKKGKKETLMRRGARVVKRTITRFRSDS
ncbi:MAG: ribosome-associated translation inhibitor RaiA [Candidatus Paceibacterota bacterium]